MHVISRATIFFALALLTSIPACTDNTPTMPCTTSADCPLSEPYCDPAIGGCSGCETDDQCVDYRATPLCNTDSGQCVECLANAECTDAAASQCNNGACAACTENAHCDGIEGKPVCNGGECVEGCTVATEPDDCGANSCDPATMACTDTERGSVNVCGSCVADSECGDSEDNESDNYRCIELDFMGASQGGKCLKRVAATCEAPYFTPIEKPSLSGAISQEYCGIRQDLTTCEAVRAGDGGATCPEDDASLCAPEGALCETIGLATDRCTYPCENDIECPSGKPACPGGFCTIAPM